ncbi:DHS-like NAD/FAD-binding domain-containing protein [Mycena belliarum]|uniref:NAD-dependent protein deacylase n=1 Tax=Mycena belliarum TaxID=1033014 RepID=A0AAD6XZ61_9AGAR|nr:DHS-like NAD/FAD-binding domain-containing protein [Mycena belliae]
MPPSTDAAEFQRILRTSKHIVAIAGAGLSAASGIPTFRSGGGLWQTHDVTKLATPQAFAADPVLVWRFYHARRRAILAAAPNAAHYALAVLALPAYRAAVAPDARYTLVTQNVDSLSTRAHREVPSPILEMHGRLLDTLCTGCGHTEHTTADPLCPALGEADDATPIAIEQLPHCLRCGALLRPGVVWFDEIPHHLRAINALVEKADLCLVVGTSSTVYPAAGYAHEIAENGGTVAVFNSERTDDDDFAHFFFVGPCEETLPRVLLNVQSSS